MTSLNDFLACLGTLLEFGSLILKAPLELHYALPTKLHFSVEDFLEFLSQLHLELGPFVVLRSAGTGGQLT